MMVDTVPQNLRDSVHHHEPLREADANTRVAPAVGREPSRGLGRVRNRDVREPTAPAGTNPPRRDDGTTELFTNRTSVILTFYATGLANSVRSSVYRPSTQ